jgi:chaperonin GroEL|tara:strand:+ start:808 stop:2397 length:1590 start_codon:yes stop_codon:yes gene_type:complete
MIEKDITLEPKDSLLEGVRVLKDAVGSTLGPNGSTVLLEDELGKPHTTKDGVTVAKSINLSDPVQHLGMSVVRQASMKTADEAGDGTTTSVVVAHELISVASEELKKDKTLNIYELCAHLSSEMNEAVEYIKRKAIDADKELLSNVARISANNDKEIGDLISNAYETLGKNTIFTIEEAMSDKTWVEEIEGTRIKKGYASSYLINDKEKGRVMYEHGVILVSDKKIETIESIMTLLKFSVTNAKPLVIVSEVSEQVQNALNVNKASGKLNVNVVAPEGVGTSRFELLEDLCIMTGATLVSDETGDNLAHITPDMLGKFKKIISTSSETTIVLPSETADAVSNRREEVENILSKNTDKYITYHIKDRLSRLYGGVAALHVGAFTEVEMKEKKDRVDDAVQAARAALDTGVVPGGGVSYLNAAKRAERKIKSSKNKYAKVANKIIHLSLQEPIYKILSNSNCNHEKVMTSVYKSPRFNYGYDAKNNKYGDLISMGIVDPFKVVKNVLQNSVSVATNILTTDVCVTNRRADG